MCAAWGVPPHTLHLSDSNSDGTSSVMFLGTHRQRLTALCVSLSVTRHTLHCNSLLGLCSSLSDFHLQYTLCCPYSERVGASSVSLAFVSPVTQSLQRLRLGAGDESGVLLTFLCHIQACSAPRPGTLHLLPAATPLASTVGRVSSVYSKKY